MKWTIPGTVLQISRADAENVENIFTSMFLAGDMSLAQVVSITGLEAYTVQNWVKRGLLSSPERKRYSKRQLCRIININMLKGVLPMERICSMLGYINGRLNDESDDMIDDTQLFFLFVKLAARSKELFTPDDSERLLEQYLKDYQEPISGAKVRVKNVLRVMLTAWLAARMQQEAEKLLENLDKEETI